MKPLEFFTNQDCERVVKKYLKNEDVCAVNFDVLQHSSNNYSIKVTVHQEDDQKILNFFGKLKTPETNKIKPNEILFKHFKKLVPGFDVKITPRIVFGNSEFLLYEDIAAQGFQTNQFDLLNLDLLKVAIKVLAKFHGGSLAYEEIKSHQKEVKYKLSDDHEFDEIDGIFKESPNAIDFISSSYQDIFGCEGNLNIKLLALVEDLERRQKSKKFRRTLCHGNLLSENIMFRNDPSGVPIECKLINFKPKYHYLPPIYDILQLIYFNTTKELRQHHLQNLLHFYYNSLGEEVTKYSLDISSILSETDLKLSANCLLPRIKLESLYLYSLRYSGSKTDDYRKLLKDSLQELEELLDCDMLSREDIHEIVSKKIGTTNYLLKSFTIKPLDEVQGYMGDYFKLKIEINQHGKNEILNCFIKCMPKGAASNVFMVDTGAFSKEAFFYETLVPMFRKCGINIINECLPECYFQRPDELLVFEDISVDNFAVKSALEHYDLDILSLTVKKLAKFHACSLIFEEKMSGIQGRPYRIGEHFGEYLKEITYLSEDESDHHGAKIMQVGMNSVVDYVDLYCELKTDERVKKFKEKLPKLRESYYTATKPSKNIRNVVSHGDLWSNNIMLKFNNNNKPIECRFIDYQLLRYCTVAQDLLSILHLTTDRKTRIEVERKLFVIYYDELTNILSSYNCDINAIMSYDQFLESIEITRPQMIIQQICYGTFCFCTSDQIKSLLTDEETSNRIFYEDRKHFLKQMYEISPTFRARGYDNVLSLYDYVILK